MVRNVVLDKVILQIRGLVDVEPRVDLDLEVLPVGVVELPLRVVDLDRLTLLPAVKAEDVGAIGGVTNRGL